MFIIGLIVLACSLFYWYFLRPMKHWEIKGITHLKPLPLFGNVFSNFLQRESISDLTQRIYNAFPDKRYIGFYQFHVPILMVRDPDLIKQIGIKDFEHFRDHSIISSDEIDPLWNKNLFSTKGDRWHNLRSTLSPTFTGSKMRSMFVLMEECAKSFTSYFVEKDQDVVTVEMKDIFSRFANDVIATCAFGVQCDSQRERENEFYLKGLEATDFSGLKAFKFFGHRISPMLMKLFKVRIFSETISNFFKGLIRDTIAYRKEKGIIRPDVINLLLEAQKNDKHGVVSTQDDITAQALIFFFAGFDTISTVLVFLTYELAVNQDIQERLRGDIENAIAENDGVLNYDVLMKVTYLDMVISESLRKWPGTVANDRLCTKKYTIPAINPGEKPVEMEPGSIVWFPQYAIQRDPQYHPDPEKFDPERFSDENKDKINPGTYLPFGIGPRNCIGSRFATMEMKTLLASILMKFDIVPVKKTPIPVVLSPKHFTPYAVGGMWLGLKRRTAN